MHRNISQDIWTEVEIAGAAGLPQRLLNSRGGERRMEQQEYAQRGYLREDFRLFHLKGAMEEQFDWHYHTFHKLIFFLGGQSGYGVEGRSYPL